MRARSLIALALLGSAIVACTPVTWQHAQLGVAPSQVELGECNQAAYYEAQRQSFFYSFARPRYFVGRDGRYHYAPWGAPWAVNGYNDRFFLERDLFDYCMRAKGYRLVEAEAPAPSE
jgi:hypothetical protein